MKDAPAFLQQLRTGTAAAHTALEQNALSSALMQDGVTKEDYVTYLSNLYGFVEGFEKHVAPKLADEIADIHVRYKSKVLAEELRSNGVEADTLPKPDAAWFTENFTDIASAWGAMYVMEGSTLGGQVIIKHLRKKLGEGFDSPYFSAYGQSTGTYWKTFLEQLNAAAENNQWQTPIIAAATKTFSLLQQWMEQAKEKVTTS